MDDLMSDSEIRSVARATSPGTEPKVVFALRRPASERFSACDVGTEMMIDFPGRDFGPVSLDQFLELAKEPPQVRREKCEGSDCLRLDMTRVLAAGPEERITLWHDVSSNYLVRKMSISYPTHQERAESFITLSEYAPGRYLPIKRERQFYRDGKLQHAEQTTLSEFHVNEAIPDSVFELPEVPDGTILRDSIQMATYPITSNWKAVGPAKPLSPRRLAIGDEKDQDATYQQASTAEASSATRWIAPASSLILLVGISGWIYRRYRGLSRSSA
jgi:hypothetical protein